MDIVFATGNRHKLFEAQQILGPSFKLMTPSDLGFDDDIPETGTTIKENAIQKARFVYDKFGIGCFADDTGLEIDALGGAPGVFSARYAGPAKNSADNIEKALRELSGVPYEKRTARFHCCIALIMLKASVNSRLSNSSRESAASRKPVVNETDIIDIAPDAVLLTFDGICEGHILTTCAGADGFGYDPIFQPLGYTKTFAELTPDEKNAISHRGIAMRALAAYLQH